MFIENKMFIPQSILFPFKRIQTHVFKLKLENGFVQNYGHDAFGYTSTNDKIEVENSSSASNEGLVIKYAADSLCVCENRGGKKFKSSVEHVFSCFKSL